MPDDARPAYFVGLDLGQAADPSALAVLEQIRIPDPARRGRTEAHYAVRALRRWPLGTKYPEIVAGVKAAFAAPPLAGAVLAVDQTGVGRAVVDLLRDARVGASIRPVTITAGSRAARDPATRDWRVPKADLVGVLQVLLQGRRIRVARDLAEAPVLAKELENFRVKVTAAGAEAYEAWKGGQHDDLVLAVGLAGWAGERGSPGGWVLPDRPPVSPFRMFGLDPWSAALRPDRFPLPE